MDLKQQELNDWQKRNFPTDHYHKLSKEQLIEIILILQVTLGVCEEAGEVAHHVLKGIQKIRGGINGIDKKEVADGLCDGLIYGLQLLTKLQMKAEDEFPEVIEQVLNRDWVKDKNTGSANSLEKPAFW